MVAVTEMPSDDPGPAPKFSATTIDQANTKEGTSSKVEDGVTESSKEKEVKQTTAEISHKPDAESQSKTEAIPEDIDGEWLDEFGRPIPDTSTSHLTRKENKALKKTRPNLDLIRKAMEAKFSAPTTPAPVIANYRLKLSPSDLQTINRILNTDGITMRWKKFETLIMHATFVTIAVGGSMVEFGSKLAEGEGCPSKILFHRLHPEAWIPYFVMKVIGKRLERVLGWGEETFAAL